MPMLGVVSSSITGNLAAPGMTALATYTATGGELEVVMSGIPQGYNYIQLRSYMRRDTTTDSLASFYNLRINNISAAEYAWTVLQNNGASSSTTAGTADTAIIGGYSGRTLDNNIRATSVVDFYDYAVDTKATTAMIWSGLVYTTGGSTFARNMSGAGVFYNFSPMTSLSILPIGELIAGSTFSLYGIK